MGDKVVYTITVTNNGPDDTTDVFVKDLLPNGLKFVSADGNYNPITGIWNIGDLLNGKTVMLKIIAQVVLSNMNITNTATVNQTNYDPNPDNNQSNTTITVGKSSDLTIHNTVNNNKPHVGDKVVYTITVKNNGPDNASGVYVKDLLPAGLKFVSAYGKYNSITGIWTIGDLLNGKTAVLKIIAQVVLSNVNITNTATVHQTNYDPNPQKQSNTTITTVKKSDPGNEGGAVIINDKTVPMQNTGVPLVGLVLAILVIFGGLLPKRKQ